MDSIFNSNGLLDGRLLQLAFPKLSTEALVTGISTGKTQAFNKRYHLLTMETQSQGEVILVAPTDYTLIDGAVHHVNAYPVQIIADGEVIQEKAFILKSAAPEVIRRGSLPIVE